MSPHHAWYHFPEGTDLHAMEPEEDPEELQQVQVFERMALSAYLTLKSSVRYSFRAVAEWTVER